MAKTKENPYLPKCYIKKLKDIMMEAALKDKNYELVKRLRNREKSKK